MKNWSDWRCLHKVGRHHVGEAILRTAFRSSCNHHSYYFATVIHCLRFHTTSCWTFSCRKVDMGSLTCTVILARARKWDGRWQVCPRADWKTVLFSCLVQESTLSHWKYNAACWPTSHKFLSLCTSSCALAVISSWFFFLFSVYVHSVFHKGAGTRCTEHTPPPSITFSVILRNITRRLQTKDIKLRKRQWK